MYLSEFGEIFVVMYKLFQRDELALADHAAATDCDIVMTFLALRANLVFVYAFDLHVKELFALGALQHRHYFRDRQNLVAQEVGYGIVDRLPGFHLDCWQHFY